MKRLALIGLTLFAFAGTAQATSSEQPPWVDTEASSLAASCGGLRAEIIARMDYARQIHVDYAVAAKDPKVAKIAGDPQWHKYWVDTYKQTIKLLKQDCSAN